MALIGIAPLTLVRTTRGSSEYVYAGAPAPEGILPEDAERLVDEGFLIEVADAAVDDVVVVPDDPATGAAGPGVTLERPKLTANKAAWAEYRGLTEVEADAVTAEQLKDDDFMASYRKPVDSQIA